jgi:hypothetical protein
VQNVRYKSLFYFVLLHSITAIPQINIYFTDWVSENNDAIQQDCLRVVTAIDESTINRQIMSYCMSELPTKFSIKKNNLVPNFTFIELSNQNITSQQLYLWSAPIDTVEQYEFYLNQLSTSNDHSLGKEVYYNCTLPRFGPMCQYAFDYHHPNHSSLHELIYNFYYNYKYQSTNFTCYHHLQCDRGLFPTCLDWSEICDGKIDCHDGGLDEEQCWQLEMNECQDNEYRCTNGQCIPQSFYLDDYLTPDCLDESDERRAAFRISEK